MSEQVNQRFAAYAWCLILAVAGGALIVGALGGSPGEKPGTVIARQDTPPQTTGASPDGSLLTGGDAAGITHVSTTE